MAETALWKQWQTLGLTPFYVFQFRFLAIGAALNEATLLHRFQQCLCKELKDELVWVDSSPTSLEVFMDLHIWIDSSLHEWQ